MQEAAASRAANATVLFLDDEPRPTVGPIYEGRTGAQEFIVRQPAPRIMRILFCSPNPLSKQLGAPKVLLELAEALVGLGWTCDVVGPAEITRPGAARVIESGEAYSDRLREYLRGCASQYDVVDYDHHHLPYPRTEFCRRSLFVARSVYLTQHLDRIRLPLGKGLRAKAGQLLFGHMRRLRQRRDICNAWQTLAEADLINVSNEEDRNELVRRRVAPDRIVVIPFGIGAFRRAMFDQIASEPPPQPVVAFVGTFDHRKGANEFPAIVRRVSADVPGVRFRLLGTRGLFQTARQVIARFPREHQELLEVVPQFAPEELPSLLAACSVGIFPSYLEGFPFGILEMLAASIPVVAYRCPGPPMMVPAENLVRPGDVEGLCARVVCLLRNADLLQAERVRAKERSKGFGWPRVARVTAAMYSERVARLRFSRL